MHFYFFCEPQLIKVSFLINNFYVSRSTKLVFLKTWMGFSIFEAVSFFIKIYFFVQRKHEHFEFKTSYFSSKLK